MSWRTRTADDRTADPAGGKLARQATASLAGLLAERGMSRKDLADRMGVSPGRVSQILSGGENLTLKSLAAVADSLGARVEITFAEPSGAPSAPSPSPAAPLPVTTGAPHRDC